MGYAIKRLGGNVAKHFPEGIKGTLDAVGERSSLQCYKLNIVGKVYDVHSGAFCVMTNLRRTACPCAVQKGLLQGDDAPRRYNSCSILGAITPNIDSPARQGIRQKNRPVIVRYRPLKNTQRAIFWRPNAFIFLAQ